MLPGPLGCRASMLLLHSAHGLVSLVEAELRLPAGLLDWTARISQTARCKTRVLKSVLGQ